MTQDQYRQQLKSNLQQQLKLKQQQQQLQDQLRTSELYDQIQVINTSDRPVCLTGLNSLHLCNTNYTSPNVIQEQQQLQQRKNLNQRIILITSPTATVVRANNLKKIQALRHLKVKQQQLIQSPTTIPSTKTRVIRVPFLPNVPNTTPSVKRTSPIKNVSLETTHPETPLSTIPKTTTSTTTRTTKRNSKNILIEPNLSDYCSSTTNCTVSPTFLMPEMPSASKTLASMAGIQLTDSEESQPTAMSGAMPTATVEAINVPVFIDEYLQQQSNLPTPNSINDNSNSSSSPGNGYDDLCLRENIIEFGNDCENIFDNFEFDLDFMETVDNTQPEEQQHQQQQQTQKDQQSDIMFNPDNIFNIINNNNNNNNMTNNNIEIDNNMFFMDFDDIKSEIKDEYDLSQQYHISPSINEDLLIIDNMENISDISDGIDLSENAIDIGKANDIELSKMMNPSNNPMLSSSLNMSSISLSQNFKYAEPFVPQNIEYFESECGATKRRITINNNNNENNKDNSNTANSNNNNNNNTANTTNMHAKRQKLYLDTSLVPAPSVIADELNTPVIIELIDKMSADKTHNMDFPEHNNFNNLCDVVSDLLSISNCSFKSASANSNTPFTNATSSYYDDTDDSPGTPQSCISTSYTNQTQNITSPNSPSLSIISTTTSLTTGSCIKKTKRGRPAKTHADRPDPSQLCLMSDEERKRAEDRAKNNEASRLSRLKNKQRDDKLIVQEDKLLAENSILKTNLDLASKHEKKLKRALERFVRKNRL